jgi:hypothetical protein
MAQKSRTGIDKSISDNIYDNTQKEIRAEMVREVLEDVRDSFFNLIDDRLASVKFNNDMTLQQYLDTIAGSVPKFGTVLNIDIGGGSGSSGALTVDNGIILNASVLQRSGSDTEIEINFKESIEGKRIIPVFKTRSLNYNANNDVGSPVVFFVSNTRIKVGLREVSSEAQSLDLEIIVI